MEWEPRPSEEVVNVACPPLNAPTPRVAVPSRKVTVPVGVPEAGATTVTVAVSVRGWPVIPGFGDAVTEVMVVPWLTVWLSAVDVLEAK